MLPKSAFYHAFNQLPGVGPQTLKAWLDRSKQPIEELWSHLSDLPYLIRESNRAEVLAAWRNCDIEKEWQRLEKGGIGTVCWDDAEYPEKLKHIGAPPTLLYYRGIFPRTKDC